MIEIVGWDRFQHYKDRWPPWIKNYTELLASDEYLSLTGNRRAILHGLWLAYAMSHGQLTDNTRAISRRLALKVTRRDLESLNDAGFITFTASTLLAERSADASPHATRANALARGRGETEAEDLRPEGSNVVERSTTYDESQNDEETNYLLSEPEFIDVPRHVLDLAKPGILRKVDTR